MEACKLMKAITVKQPGGSEQLVITDHCIPVPKENEVLVKVQAAAVNRTDIINRESQGGYVSTPILGVEIAGIVEEAGSKAKIKKGTRVMGLVDGGGYAEYAVMASDRAMIIPEKFSFEEAAAIPEVFLTAYQTLFEIGKLTADETVLIHAGGSGVGTAAIQLAKQLGKAKVIVTAGSEEKLAFCRRLGADICINYKEQNFDEEVLAVTNHQGVDLILDFIGASYWDKNMSSIKIDGRWVLIGILGGRYLENVDLMALMTKRIQLTGTLLTPRSNDYKVRLTQKFVQEALPLLENGQLKPIVGRTFSFSDIKQAHEYMEKNKNIGKIILKIKD